MNKGLAKTLDEIADIGKRIADLTARSRELRLSLITYYDSLAKMNDGATGAVYMSDHQLLAMVKPVRDDDTDRNSKIKDFTVTFCPCDRADFQTPDDETARV